MYLFFTDGCINFQADLIDETLFNPFKKNKPLSVSLGISKK